MAAKKGKRIYWDSCVYIDRIERVPEKIAVLDAITLAAEKRSVVLLASTLVLAEVAKTGKQEDADEEEKVRKLAELWENDFFVVQQLDRQLALKAAEFVRLHGLKP